MREPQWKQLRIEPQPLCLGVGNGGGMLEAGSGNPAAIVDRLTFGGNIIETGTSSYRLAHARKQRTPNA